MSIEYINNRKKKSYSLSDFKSKIKDNHTNIDDLRKISI